MAVASVEEYVSGLDRALRGPRRVKRDMLAEVRDGLCDAAEALESGGLCRAEAERAAVEEFGAIEEIAPGYQEELIARQGRRTAALLFVGVPLTTIMWSLIWRFFPDTVTLSPVRDWPSWYLAVARTMDVMQLLTGVLGAVALVTLGRGARRFRRARLVTRGLGLLIWCELPFVVGMSLALMWGGNTGFGTFVPGLLASLVSNGLLVWQLYSASRCLTLGRERPATA
ncbi:hypothetical protein Misp01_17800 [Microtetraspora sp. NBRC 13810]|uniref:permease prefix domain 1-containing protein n=1 Tax=Microtetraspora sp. NBRC 13810 TaxID=3030990 RepID=UPI0024A1C017|nr:permease prefix domain 1-containing protein [Microtetraspora sp. NBRC 13810]GLW06650.1 hypothetical protein Misp01_17800 [Microtetraspora sp. NBRC 13810]